MGKSFLMKSNQTRLVSLKHDTLSSPHLSHQEHQNIMKLEESTSVRRRKACAITKIYRNVLIMSDVERLANFGERYDVEKH